MKTARTYIELFEPTIVLTLHRTPTGYYGVTDQHGRLYYPPTKDVTACLRFMQAMAAKRDAVIDEASVERVTWEAAQEFSVRVPSNVLPFRKAAG